MIHGINLDNQMASGQTLGPSAFIPRIAALKIINQSHLRLHGATSALAQNLNPRDSGSDVWTAADQVWTIRRMRMAPRPRPMPSRQFPMNEHCADQENAGDNKRVKREGNDSNANTGEATRVCQQSSEDKESFRAWANMVLREKVSLNPPAMDEIIIGVKFEDVVRQVERATECPAECFRIYLEKLASLMLMSEGIVPWFISRVGDTMPFLGYAVGPEAALTGEFEVLARNAAPKSYLSTGPAGTQPLLFRCVAALQCLDDTPAYQRHSISYDMACMFGGNPVRDSEDVEDGVLRFRKQFPTLLRLETLDNELLRQLFNQLCQCHQRAMQLQQRGARSCRQAFAAVCSELTRATNLVVEKGREQGIPLAAPSVEAAAAVPAVRSAGASPSSPAAGAGASSSGSGRVYLRVAYKDKDAAKADGARWDSEKKLWYAPTPQSPAARNWPHAAEL